MVIIQQTVFNIIQPVNILCWWMNLPDESTPHILSHNLKVKSSWTKMWNVKSHLVLYGYQSLPQSPCGSLSAFIKLYYNFIHSDLVVILVKLLQGLQVFQRLLVFPSLQRMHGTISVICNTVCHLQKCSCVSFTNQNKHYQRRYLLMWGSRWSNLHIGAYKYLGLGNNHNLHGKNWVPLADKHPHSTVLT